MAVTGRSPTVQLSLGVPNFGRWAGADLRALVDVARVADEAGVDRLVVTAHGVMGRRTDAYRWGRFPTAPDAPWLEPLTCLAAFAVATTRVRLATGILIAPLRPAPLLAKTVATLDVLSGGRVDLGVGVGWQREEYDAAGLDFTDRGGLLEDTVGACRALWSQLPASYTSARVSVDDVFCAPQPIQQPLPVWFSGTLTDRHVRRIQTLGDGWIPIMGATLDDIRAGASRLRASIDRPLTVQAPAPPVKGDDGTTDPAATFAQLPALVAAGVTSVYVNVASFARTVADAVDVLPRLTTAFRAALP